MTVLDDQDVEFEERVRAALHAVAGAVQPRGREAGCSSSGARRPVAALVAAGLVAATVAALVVRTSDPPDVPAGDEPSATVDTVSAEQQSILEFQELMQWSRLTALSPYATAFSSLHVVDGVGALAGVGSADGVLVGMPVVAPGGLIGRVSSVEEYTASVELMTDRGFTVGAAIVDTFAVLKGQGAGKPMVAQLPADAGRFLIGAAAVTVVGLDPPWPANIPIGEITALHLDAGSAGPTAELAPYADPAATEMVAVVLLAPGSSPEAPAITEPTETAVSELETGPGGG